MLAAFRPSKASLEDLEKLLECGADPDIVIGEGDLKPLRSVLCFAPQRNVAAMREALLKHGAVETAEDFARWRERNQADLAEKEWLRKFHRDDRSS